MSAPVAPAKDANPDPKPDKNAAQTIMRIYRVNEMEMGSVTTPERA